MDERQLFPWLLGAWLALAAVVFPLLLFVTAPYGRHNRKGWGPQIPRTVGWIAMELPSPVLMGLLFFVGERTGIAALTFLLLWEVHYIHRSLIFPFRMQGGARQMPLLIALFALCFNLCNAYFNGRYLFALGPDHAVGWLLDPRFLGGAALFAGGFAINIHSDNILLRLRREGEGYRIPHGGLFELVSCPNYLGEVLEWCGWAICTWSLPGLAFAVWTAANLMPRARSNHRWYVERFPDYPRQRRAVVPYLF
jgi:3-oxo-5-alpha-steroid 4-dehydrogenase 1